MLKQVFMIFQFLFAGMLVQVYQKLSLAGELSVKSVIALIFIFISGFALSLLLNDNLLKSRVLSARAKHACCVEEDKKHLMFLINERRCRTTQIILTELLLLGMIGLYCQMTQSVGLISLFNTFGLHAVFVSGVGIVHLIKDGNNKKTIGRMSVQGVN